MMEGIRNLSSDLVSLITGFILVLPISIFLSLSIFETIVAGVVTAIPIVLVYHFQFSATDLSVRNVISSGVLVASSSLFYAYSTKFLGMSAGYITSMVRDIRCKTGIGCEIGSQMNLSYFSLESLLLVYGGFILLCYLLVQNEFSNLINLPSDIRRGKSNIFEGVVSSFFGILMFLLAFVLSTMIFELSPGTQIPFMFLGGALVAGIILLNDSIPVLFKPDTYRKISLESIGPLTTILSIVIFIGITLNLAFIPIISQNIPEVLSIMTMIVGLSWAYILSKELSSPEIQAKRTAALAFFVMFPFLSYLILRFIFLQVDGTNPVMLNRWGLDFDFMDKVNTFKINPWPLEAEPNWDSRWVFLKAAINNSARVTLVSIFFCTILGIIIGVTRLSSNKLASTAATVYVEVFRNLPLAVLLFLIATQIGLQFPMFIDEKSLLFGAVYYSNEGIWFATFSSYGALFLAIIGLAFLRMYLRHSDRIEPRSISVPKDLSSKLSRPFHKLGWRYEALAADVFLILAFVFLVARVSIGESLFNWLPNYHFETLFSPVVSSPESGNIQSLSGNLRIMLGPVLGIGLVIYAFLVSSRIEDDGMNSMEIDDSEEGLRKRFTIWVGAIALALGFTFAGGYYKMGEILSFPEYTKDWNNDGVIDSPGSWDIVEGTGFEITPFFLAMVLGLTLFTAAVVAEIVRGSIQSLPRGQVEAAISLSLNPFQRLRLVILPQALRSMVPLLNNQFMNVWKNSSLAVVVAYTDIFYVILVMMNNVGQLIPLFLLLLVTYQAGSLTISAVMNWYNSRVTSVKI